MLEQSYLQPREWTVAQERRYQTMRPLAESLLQAPMVLRKAGSHPPEETKFWSTFEELRFRRLACFLRAREPDAMIGYSILIYRLDQAEVHAALHGSWSEWVNGMNKSRFTP